MDNFALNATATALNEKNMMIVQLQHNCAYFEDQCQYQQTLLVNEQAEKIRLVRELNLCKAAFTAELADKDAMISKLQEENAMLKKRMEKKAMYDLHKLQVKKVSLSRLQGAYNALKKNSIKVEKNDQSVQTNAEVFRSNAQTQTSAKVFQSNAQTQTNAKVAQTNAKVTQSNAVTQTKTGYVLFAAERTNAIQESRLKEILKVLDSLADLKAVLADVEDVLYWIAEIEEQKEELENQLCLEMQHNEERINVSAMLAPVIEVTQPNFKAAFTVFEAEMIETAPEVEVTQPKFKAAFTVLETETIETAPEVETTKKAKKANKKKKAPKETPEEKAAREEAERKAHDESARLKKQQERREEAKKTADRKAKIHALRAKKEQEVRDEAMQAKTAEPRAAIQPNPAALVKYTDSLRAMGNLHDFVGPYDA
jgi:hypothetical protein